MGYKSISIDKGFSISKLVMIHYFEYSKDFFFKGESHDFFELLYVDNGTIEVIEEDEIYILERGSFFLHEPNKFHSLRACEKSTPPTLIMLSFLFESKQSLLPLCRHEIKAVSEEKALVGKLISEAQVAFSNPLNIPSHRLRKNKNAPFGAQQLVLNYLEQLLVLLIREQLEQGDTFKPLTLKATIPESKNNYVAEVLLYLLENIDKSLSIDEICRANKLGRSRIQELFHQEFSCGIIEYFNLMKADAAKGLLRSSDKSIGEIAELLGFSSQAYFAKQFKNAFGRTPTQYRKSVASLTKKIAASPRLRY